MSKSAPDRYGSRSASPSWRAMMGTLFRGLGKEASLGDVDVVGLAVGGQENAVAVGGLDEGRGPCLLLYGLEKLVITAIEDNDGMRRVAFKVGVVVTTFQACQFIA